MIMVKVQLSEYNNNWYKPGNGVKRMCWYFINILFIKNSWFVFSGFKIFLLRLFGAKLGKGIVLKPNVNIKYPWFLEIGDYSWIGEGVWIDNLGAVKIGANVCLSQGAFLLSGNHDYTSRLFDLRVEPIVIEEGVWIGARAIVCGGAICKSHSVLSAGSLTAGILEEYSIYKGNPAVKIRERIIKG